MVICFCQNCYVTCFTKLFLVPDDPILRAMDIICALFFLIKRSYTLVTSTSPCRLNWEVSTHYPTPATLPWVSQNHDSHISDLPWFYPSWICGKIKQLNQNKLKSTLGWRKSILRVIDREYIKKKRSLAVIVMKFGTLKQCLYYPCFIANNIITPPLY